MFIIDLIMKHVVMVLVELELLVFVVINRVLSFHFVSALDVLPDAAIWDLP
jgi:hypothetical protein